MIYDTKQAKENIKQNSGNKRSTHAAITTTKAAMTNLGDEVQAALTLLLLELEGDAADGASLDSLHKVGDESGDFISHSLGRDDGNLSNQLLVDVEVKG